MNSLFAPATRKTAASKPAMIQRMRFMSAPLDGVLVPSLVAPLAHDAFAVWLLRHIGDRAHNRPRGIPEDPLEIRKHIWYTCGVPLPHFLLFLDHQNAVRI